MVHCGGIVVVEKGGYVAWALSGRRHLPLLLQETQPSRCHQACCFALAPLEKVLHLNCGAKHGDGLLVVAGTVVVVVVAAAAAASVVVHAANAQSAPQRLF